MLEKWHKGNNAPSVRSPVVDVETMKPGHWLGSALCVPFRALTLMVWWLEGHSAHKNVPLILRFCSGTDGGGRDRELADSDLPEKNGH